MEKTEMRAIWDMMAAVRPSDKRLTDKRLMQVWWDALSDYDAQTVRQAVAEHLRRSNYFPDLSELNLPPLAGKRLRDEPYGDSVERLRERWYEQRKAREKAGLPASAFEAKERGMSAAEWFKAVDDAGLAL